MDRYRWSESVEERLRAYKRLIAAGKSSVLAALPVSGVYFIKVGDAVKIGSTVDLIRRFAMYPTYSPEPCELIGFLPATHDKRKRERQWLRKWAHSNIHGEWFRLTPELAREIREAQQPIAENENGTPLVEVLEHRPETNNLIVWSPFCGNRHFHGAMGLPRGADLSTALGLRGADCGGGDYALVVRSAVPTAT